MSRKTKELEYDFENHMDEDGSTSLKEFWGSGSINWTRE